MLLACAWWCCAWLATWSRMSPELGDVRLPFDVLVMNLAMQIVVGDRVEDRLAAFPIAPERSQIRDRLRSFVRGNAAGRFAADAGHPDPVRAPRCATELWRRLPKPMWNFRSSFGIVEQFSRCDDALGGPVVMPVQLAKRAAVVHAEADCISPSCRWRGGPVTRAAPRGRLGRAPEKSRVTRSQSAAARARGAAHPPQPAVRSLNLTPVRRTRRRFALISMRGQFPRLPLPIPSLHRRLVRSMRPRFRSESRAMANDL